jgi:hypothetical protein
MDNNNKKLLVIFPERNRTEHQKIIIPYIKKYLDLRNIKYKIIIVHQDNEIRFNKGILMNIGFKYAVNNNLDFDYICLHDIDMIPFSPILSDVLKNDTSFYYYKNDEPNYYYTDTIRRPFGTIYSTKLEKQFVHTPENQYDQLGGVVIMNRDVYEQINGFSNIFENWGQEDNNLTNRSRQKNINIDFNIDNNFVALDHTKSPVNHKNHKIFSDHCTGLTTLKITDKLPSFNNLKEQYYKINKIINVDDVTELYVDFPPINEKDNNVCVMSDNNMINYELINSDNLYMLTFLIISFMVLLLVAFLILMHIEQK